jgi:hypothetical protein
MASYVFDHATVAETSMRFSYLDALYNLRTFRSLEANGIGSGWHCLAIGGSGSVAGWMCRQGPGLCRSAYPGDFRPRPQPTE